MTDEIHDGKIADADKHSLTGLDGSGSKKTGYLTAAPAGVGQAHVTEDGTPAIGMSKTESTRAINARDNIQTDPTRLLPADKNVQGNLKGTVPIHPGMGRADIGVQRPHPANEDRINDIGRKVLDEAVLPVSHPMNTKGR